MCTYKPSGNKTYFMVFYKDTVCNYMLQRGVLFPSSGGGDAEQLLLLCSQTVTLKAQTFGPSGMSSVFGDGNSTHLVTKKGGSWTDQV